MVRVLLTGGNGFVASHILDLLVSQGNSVTFTVRSVEKGNKVLARFRDIDYANIQCCVVPDFTVKGAFDDCFKTNFDAVIHTASPFTYSVSDIQKDLLDPSIIGTQSLLEAVQKHAPSVKTVIFTSSFAAILDSYKPNEIPNHTYDATQWNPLTKEDAFTNTLNGYRASKLFAERAAWDFMDAHKPAFSLVSICPTLAFGPVIQPIESAEELNTSSQRIFNFINGSCRSKMPNTGMSFFLWVDVRDLAMAHVKAMEMQLQQQNNRRYLITSGYFTNKEVCNIIGDEFAEYQDVLPGSDGQEGGFPAGGIYKFDDGAARDELNVAYRSLKESVMDTVLSLKARKW